MTIEIVLDASALLAVVNQEPGWQAVVAYRAPMISAVNLAEVYAKLEERGSPSSHARSNLAASGVEVITFDETQAYLSGQLRMSTRRAGLSFGDRACLAAAMSRDLPVLTGDRSWATLDVGIEVGLFR